MREIIKALAEIQGVEQLGCNGESGSVLIHGVPVHLHTERQRWTTLRLICLTLGKEGGEACWYMMERSSKGDPSRPERRATLARRIYTQAASRLHHTNARR